MSHADRGLLRGRWRGRQWWPSKAHTLIKNYNQKQACTSKYQILERFCPTSKILFSLCIRWSYKSQALSHSPRHRHIQTKQSSALTKFTQCFNCTSQGNLCVSGSTSLDRYKIVRLPVPLPLRHPVPHTNRWRWNASRTPIK